MKATIKELEKRRDQAIKEIRSLKHQIAKDKKNAQAAAAMGQVKENGESKDLKVDGDSQMAAADQ